MRIQQLKKWNIVLAILSLLSCSWITGCDNNAPKNSGKTKKVIIFAAASTTNAIKDIAAEFTKTTGIEVVTNFAASSSLAQQIETGAEADIFISADQKWADYLAEKQFCHTRAALLGNSIVIIVPADSSLSADSAQILLSPEIKSIATGDPSAVPVGKYAREALEKLGLWDKIKNKIASAQDVRSALAFVETRAAEAGIVYSTDAAISSKVKVIFTFPQNATAKPITYPAMTLKKAVNRENADLFFNYLKSDIAMGIFKRYGFLVN
jgi:molybdate transport system substrate-binding protein